MGAIKVTAWLASGAFAILLLTQPVSVEAQRTLSLTFIVVMTAVWWFVPSRQGRQLFLALGSFIAIRYIYWRITNTLPSWSDPIGFSFGTMLLLAELYCVLILVISLIINVDPLQRERLPREEDDKLPTVDVFIPTYNEDEYILAMTVAAAKNMDYPAEKLKVWLLDDGGTEQKCNDPNPEKAAAAMQRRVSLQLLCSQLGAIYHTRERNEHAKAGNMNAALAHSTGEIVVVFDADHGPFRSFLRETIGYFARDPKLFLVQTPHVFINPDPIERNLRTFSRMPSENEMFYSVTQRGLDKWNASFFCGSAALLRRSALKTTGGFSGITITEDCETAFELHSKGWTSVFVDEPLIAGLQPETFASFVGQRSRWCQGMFQILLLKNPALKRGLNVIQKLAYLSSMTFWFFPIPRLVFMLAPLTHIFFDVKIFTSNLDEAIGYTATYMCVNIMLQNYLYGKVRWPWVSELYEYVQGVYLVKAIVSVALRPRKPTFNVTAKGITLEHNHLSDLAWPFFAMYGLLLVGSVTALYRYLYEPGVTNLMLVVGLWNAFNMVIAGAGLGCVAERREPRRHPRLAIERTGTLSTKDGDIPVIIRDVSAGGCSVVPVGSLSELPTITDGTEGRLAIEPRGLMVGTHSLPAMVRHMSGTSDNIRYGLQFAEISAAEYYVLADLMYGDPDAIKRFLASRRKHKNVLAGTLTFMRWGFAEPFRAFSYLLGAAGNKPADRALPSNVPATVWLRRLARIGKAAPSPIPTSLQKVA
jgi:cellulose synthase (UDP-forming)